MRAQQTSRLSPRERAGMLHIHVSAAAAAEREGRHVVDLSAKAADADTARAEHNIALVQARGEKKDTSLL